MQASIPIGQFLRRTLGIGADLLFLIAMLIALILQIVQLILRLDTLAIEEQVFQCTSLFIVFFVLKISKLSTGRIQMEHID